MDRKKRAKCPVP